MLGCNLLILNGEPGGARTRDHRIKSAMLYQLSYRLSLDWFMKRD